MIRETAAIIEQASELRDELRLRRKQLEEAVEATRELQNKLRERRGLARLGFLHKALRGQIVSD